MVDTITPKSLEDALKVREETNGILFAGGTDLMVKRKTWGGIIPKFGKPVIFIGNLKELKGIKESRNILKIGAGETMSSIMNNGQVPEVFKECISQIASPAIRNIGTIGGNICNASPAGDTLPLLYAFGAWIILQSQKGIREIPIEKFILGPGKTCINPDEILVQINIPIDFFNMIKYKKIGTRKADAISKLSFAGLKRVVDQKIEDIRIAFGAVAPTVVRVKEAEDILKGLKIDELEDVKTKIKDSYSNYIKPIDDQRSSAYYRKTVAFKLLEDFLNSSY